MPPLRSENLLRRAATFILRIMLVTLALSGISILLELGQHQT
jgi:hypothetical protein